MKALNPMQKEAPLPQKIIEAYPLLIGNNVEYVGCFTPKVPTVPDRTYDVYHDSGSDRILTHITSDYPDPIHDSEELQSISGYRFENIIKPNANDEIITITNNDDPNEEFFVKIGDIYHYVVNTEENP